MYYDEELMAYQCGTPEEDAMLQSAWDLGFTYEQVTNAQVSVRTTKYSQGVDTYEKVIMIPYTSQRQRMSILLKKVGSKQQQSFQDEEGKYILITKGADSVILPRLKALNQGLEDVIDDNLYEMASEGLRTMVYTKKYMTED